MCTMPNASARQHSAGYSASLALTLLLLAGAAKGVHNWPSWAVATRQVQVRSPYQVQVYRVLESPCQHQAADVDAVMAWGLHKANITSHLQLFQAQSDPQCTCSCWSVVSWMEGVISREKLPCQLASAA